MAESTNHALPGPTPNGVERSQAKSGPVPVKKYSIPIPLRTFPLPAFYPSNPISLLHLALAWLGQIFYPPAAEPAVVYRGVWSPDTRSVHVTDLKSMNDLWCQGFFGKGSLSRSEPTWLRRQLSETIEQRTNKRREQRANSKWERGRSELEAIERRRLEEAARATPENGTCLESLPAGPCELPLPLAPVGPQELLALPNSASDLKSNGLALNKPAVLVNGHATQEAFRAPVGPSELLVLPNSAADLPKSGPGSAAIARIGGNGSFIRSTSPSGDEAQPLKRQKSVRFAANVESTTFQHTDPPSPNHNALAVALMKPQPSGIRINGGAVKEPADISLAEAEAALDYVNKEHLQLSLEETFFLAYGLGALVVADSDTQELLTTAQLFALCRRFSYFPPRAPDEPLASDDPFLVHYAVYHHFRSLGWVPRHGIKFGVDWLLYGKGPALDHAEFGVIVVPSYSDARWKGHHGRGSGVRRKTWHWLHSVNRVLSTVFKSLVLVYVDVPPPSAAGGSPSELLPQFQIHEVMVRRWSSNRNRD